MATSFRLGVIGWPELTCCLPRLAVARQWEVIASLPPIVWFVSHYQKAENDNDGKGHYPFRAHFRNAP